MSFDLSKLLPSPKCFEAIPGQTNLTQNPIVHLERTGFDRSAEYEIVASDTLAIRARNEAGVRAAKQTLSQISLVSSPTTQSFRIHDWAAFDHRGFMLDVSRDRIPTMHELKELVALLASLKYNHLQLYIEHTFAYAGHGIVSDGLDPITGDQIRTLDKWCQDSGIELAANQNCFGHLAKWLKHPKYAHLAETHVEFDFFGMNRKGPFSLSPTNPGSLSLVHEWIKQLSACHNGGRINIGCDETSDVGAGQSAESVSNSGFAHVYSSFVNSVARVCKQEEFHPMFWADIALSQPESLAILDNSMTSLVWGYEPDSKFAESLVALNEHGFTSWVCPGTSCWRSFTGRSFERKTNIQAASSLGVEHGCDGFLLTAWGDLGHRQQWPITLRAIADGAEAAWSGSETASAGASDAFAFGQTESGIASWLDALGNSDLQLREANPDHDLPRLLNASALFHELHPAHESQQPRGTLKQWLDIRDRLAELHRIIPTPSHTLLTCELAHVHRCAMFAADVAIMRRGGPQAPDVHEIVEEHESLWLQRSRPAGLDSSSEYYRKIHCSLGTNL
jgi:hexosaminidase